MIAVFRRTKVGLWPVLILAGLFLIGAASAAGAPGPGDTLSEPIETSILTAAVGPGGRTLNITGLASGRLAGIELALRRGDGWFWSPEIADWIPDPTWHKGTLMPMGSTSFAWDEKLTAPPTDGAGLLLLARAVGGQGQPDPKPAGARLFVDNIQPAIGKFDIDGARWSSSRDVTLTIEATGAKYIRLAESINRLGTAKKLLLRRQMKFKLSSGDGLKRVFAAVFDSAGNRVVKSLDGGAVGLDTAPPVINTFAPAGDAESVSVGAKISAGFIEGSEVDPATLRSDSSAGHPTFYLTRGGLWTTATVEYDARQRTAVLTPTEPLIKGELYTAHLMPGIRDVAGNEFEDEIEWTFRAVEPSPPETKIDGLPERLAARKSLLITGSAADSDGIDAVGVFVRDQEGRYWDAISASWTIEPFANQAALGRRGQKQTGWEWRWRLPGSDGARYVVTAAARDRFLAEDPTPAGSSLLVDNEAPRVGRLVLQNSQPVTASDTIVLSAVVDGAAQMRFAETPAKLKNKAWQPFAVETSMTLSEKEGKKQVFGQWRDALGNATRVGEAGSTARIILDKTGPKVSSTFPQDQADDVNVSVMVTANFDEISLDETWITTGTFSLVGPDNNPVPASVTFDRQSKSATLTPLEFLSYGTKYRVTLSGAIKDRLGNAIGHAYGWTFKTITMSTHPPPAPRDLKVVSTERGDKLTWSPPTGIDAGRDFRPPVQGGYNIYRGQSADGPFDLVNKVPIAARIYYDKDYERPGRRFYTVKAVDAGGSESAGAEVGANDDIDTRFNLKAGQVATVTPSNDTLRLKLPPLKRSVKLRVRTQEPVGAPATPMRLVVLDSSPTIKLKSLSLLLPGDPTGAMILRRESGGWQPLVGAAYERDIPGRTVTVGPLSSTGEYIIVNRADPTPPPTPPTVSVSSREGRPLISWGKISDADSGISAYRLWRGETTAALETLTTAAVVDLPGTMHSFVDHSAEPGRRYYYWVSAVNGAGAPGPAGAADPTATPQPMVEHRPRVAGVTNCQSCHIETRARNEMGQIDCRLCHDGTGSSIVITGYDGRNSLCRTCHALNKGQLGRAGSSNAVQCGGCHLKPDTGVAVRENGHTGRSGLDSMACISCHSLHRPRGRQTAYLVDPANTRKPWSGSISDFCLACHRATGWPQATEALERFVPRNIVFSTPASPLFPGWSKTGWKRSSHKQVAACPACHQSHQSPNQRLVGFRAKGGKYIYFTEYSASEALCYECHRPGGPRGAADLLTLSRAPVVHSANTFSAHSDVETAADLGMLNRHANCNDCHNVHEARGGLRRSLTNRASGVLKGVAGVEPVNSGPGAAPSFIEVFPAGREYQICLKCHSSYVKTPPPGLIDYAVKFNPANPSYHPVEARGKNRGVKSVAFVNGWNQAATMYCSDCHSYPAEPGTARGPHGSKHKSMLAGEFGEPASTDRQNDLCYLCHNQKTYKDGEEGSRFGGPGGHADHIAKNKIGCFKCHETHGSSFTDHLIKVVQPLEASGTVGYTHDTTGGACVSSCHARPAESYQYKHSY